MIGRPRRLALALALALAGLACEPPPAAPPSPSPAAPAATAPLRGPFDRLADEARVLPRPRLRALDAHLDRPAAIAHALTHDLARYEGELLCSLYQLGWTGFTAEHKARLLDHARAHPDRPNVHMALILGAALAGEVPRATVEAFTRAHERRLLGALARGDTLEARRWTARALTGLRALGLPPSPALAGLARAHFFPWGRARLPPRLTQAAVLDLIVAHHLGLPIDRDAARRLARDALRPDGTARLADCDRPDCPLKGLQQLAYVDYIHDLLRPEDRQRIAALLTADFGARTPGAFDFPRRLGLPADLLWNTAPCDFFCSTKHWHTMMTLNIVLPVDG